jgi:hypothetical protein
MNRYFLISFSHAEGFGYLTMESDKHPSEKWIYQSIEKAQPEAINPRISSIYEFKNKEDFDAFNSEE